MTLDITTVLVIAALVVNLAGVLFILETLLRRDEGAGRIWSLGYFAAMLMTLAYVLWTQTHDSWWAIAVGNASLVASVGFMWLGCRSYNGRRILWSTVAVVALTGASGVSVLVEGPAGGDWAAAEWMFASIVLFAGAAAVECMRGALLASRSAWVLGFALGVYSLYYVSRTTAFVTSGPDSALFQDGFGTVPTALWGIAYTMVAVVATSVLLAGRAPMRGVAGSAALDAIRDAVLEPEEFEAALRGLCERAERRGETVGVIAVRIDDMEQISTAFGSETARAVAVTWERGVRRHAPSNAFVGADGPTGLVVGLLVFDAAEARRRAAVIYRGLFDDLGRVGHGVIPVVGVGVGLSDTAGYDAADLLRVAREAAERAALSIETSVLVGDEARTPLTGP